MFYLWLVFCIAIKQHLTLMAARDYNHKFEDCTFLFWSPCWHLTCTVAVFACVSVWSLCLSALTSLTAFISCMKVFFSFIYLFFSMHSSGFRLASLSQHSLCRTPATVCCAAAAAATAVFLQLALACVHTSGAQSQPALAPKSAFERVCRLFVQSAK